MSAAITQPALTDRQLFFSKLMKVSIVSAILVLISIVVARFYVGVLGSVSGVQFGIELSFPAMAIVYSLYCYVKIMRGGDETFYSRLYMILNATGVALAVTLFNGYQSPAFVIFIWAIGLAGMLFSPKYAIYMGGVAIGWFVCLFAFEKTGIYRPLFTLNPQLASFQTSLFLVLSMFPALALLTNVSMMHMGSLMRKLEVNNEQLQLVANILDNTHNGLLVADSAGRVILINPAFLTMTGRKKLEVLGQSLKAFQDQLLGGGSFSDVLREVKAKGLWQKEVRAQRENGDALVLSVTINGMGLSLGEISHWICIFSDVTKIRMAESASNAKSMFLAHMSHEIRTPMNGVIGMTQLALESNPDPEMGHYLKTIQNSANNLIHIINDILDFSKIEAGQMVLENHPFNIREMGQSCIDMFAFAARKRGSPSP